MISFPFLPLKHTRIIYIYASKTQKNKLKINSRPWYTSLCSGHLATLVSSPHGLAKRNRVFLSKNTSHIIEPSELTTLWACTQQQKSFFPSSPFVTHKRLSPLATHKGSSPLVTRRVRSSCDTWRAESSCDTRWVESSCDIWRVESSCDTQRVELQHIKAQVLLWHTKGWVWHMKGWVLFWHMKGWVLFQHTKCQVLFRHIKHRVLLWHTKGQVLLCSSEEYNFVAHQDTHQNTQQFKEVWGVCVGGWGVGGAGGGVGVGGGQVRMCRVRLWIQWVLSYQLKLLIDDRFTRAGMHASSRVFIRSYKLTVGSVQSGIEFSECSVKN